MAQLIFDKVTKRYGDVTAVHEFNLKVPNQEFLVLVGPSGCGKSTTLRMVAGLEEISGGSLFIGDRRVNDIPPKDRDIAMVFQNYALYPHMTVFDNMCFALKLRKMPKTEIQKKVQDVAQSLDIAHLLKRKPKQLSGGQRQRVAMGRAIVRDPKVFLFDEPLSNLDAKLRVQMRVELSRLHNRLKTTVVYVTHDQVEAMTLADRIVVMKDGIIQQAGSPMELFHKPKNAFVGSFIGSPSMNLLQANVHTEGDTTLLKSDHFSLSLPDQIAASLHAYDGGKRVTIGVRPQHLSPAGEGSMRFESSVDVIEPMGSETYYYLQLGDTPITARSEGASICTVGKATTFAFEETNLHIFTEDGSARIH